MARITRSGGRRWAAWRISEHWVGIFGKGVAINDFGHVAGYALTTTGSADAFRWTAGHGMRDLGNFGGATSGSFATAINLRGQVTGWSYTPGGTPQPAQHAFLWTPHRGLQDLGTFGGAVSLGRDLNDLGEVTGVAQTDTGADHAFVWTRSGMRDLGTLGGENSSGSAINDRGQVAGQALTADGSQHAFRWTP